MPHEVVLREMLYATTIGMVDMVWSPICQRCGGAVSSCKDIGQIVNSENAICQGCSESNQVSQLDNIKVFFVFTQSIMYVPANGYECPHSSARLPHMAFFGFLTPTTTGSGFSYLFGFDDEKSQPAFAAGRYRIVCPYSRIDCRFDIERDATDDDKPLRRKICVSEMRKSEIGKKHKIIKLEHGKVRLDFVSDTDSISVLFWFHDMDDELAYRLPEADKNPVTTATHCIHHPSFKYLFSDQVVGEASRFTISNVVLVFTDVVSSTALYEECGDGKALDTVRDHFKVLFKSIAGNGRIVKTVGDAVMGAFTTGSAAIETVAVALDGMIKAGVMRPSGDPLQIRVGIHAGSALMVPLNGINDYFGSTVNVAARVESKATNGECLVSQAVLDDPAAKATFDRLLESGYGHTRDVQLTLKGVVGTVKASGFRSKYDDGDED